MGKTASKCFKCFAESDEDSMIKYTEDESQEMVYLDSLGKEKPRDSALQNGLDQNIPPKLERSLSSISVQEEEIEQTDGLTVSKIKFIIENEKKKRKRKRRSRKRRNHSEERLATE